MESETKSIRITEMNVDDLLQALCETAIALYCYDLVVKNGMQPDAKEQQINDLKSAFDAVRIELARRASRGSRKRKAVSA